MDGRKLEFGWVVNMPSLASPEAEAMYWTVEYGWNFEFGFGRVEYMHSILPAWVMTLSTEFIVHPHPRPYGGFLGKGIFYCL